MKSKALSILFLFFFLFIPIKSLTASQDDYEIMRITNNDWIDWGVNIDGDWLSWKVKGLYLYLYNYKNEQYYQFPYPNYDQLNDGILLFVDLYYDGPYLYIISQDLLIDKLSENVCFLNFSCDEVISYPWIVFSRRSNNHFEVYSYNIEQAFLKKISQNYLYSSFPHPVTDGKYVIWIGDGSLFVYNLESNILLKDIFGGCKFGAKISEGKVLFRKGDELVSYDCERREIDIIERDFRWGRANYDISNGYIVWTQDYKDNYNINLYNISDKSNIKIGKGGVSLIEFPFVIWKDIKSFNGPDIIKVYNIASRETSTIQTNNEIIHHKITNKGIVVWESYHPENIKKDEIYLAKPKILELTIDIKPGSHPNSINLTSKGKIPVAVLSSDVFDAASIDSATVSLAGAPVIVKRNGSPMATLEDVNLDGFLDLVLHFDTSSLLLGPSDTEAVLEGLTYDGRKVQGTDSVRIVVGD